MHLRREDENEAAIKAARKEQDPSASRAWTEDASGVVEEHIGPVQFNMGGIQVNADEMVKRLQVRGEFMRTVRRFADFNPGPASQPIR